MNWVKGIKGFVYSNIWVAINVVSLYLFVALHLDLPVDFRYAGLLFWATLFAYNFQRLLKNVNSASYLIRSERHLWIEENQTLIQFLAGVGALCTLLFSIWILPPVLILLSVPALVIVMFYTRRNENMTALRNIPLLKIFLISIVWVFVVLIIPLLLLEKPINSGDLQFGILLFLFVAVLCIPFDIRDRKVDVGKLKTIPVVLGEKRSKYLAAFVMLGTALWAFFNEIFAFPLVSFFVIPSLIYTNEERSELFFAGWIEGQFLLLLLLELVVEVI